MSIRTSIPEGDQPIAASNGIPGDEPLSIDVAIAINWNNRTRIAAWTNAVGIEILLDPISLAKLIMQLQLAQTAILQTNPREQGWCPEKGLSESEIKAVAACAMMKEEA